jgi:transcription antitermination factor NusG
LIVLRTEGVIGFVGVRGEGTPVRDAEIESVRLLLSRGVPFAAYPFLKIGQRVRIRGGSLDGVEGVIVGDKGDRKLVISVELIQRSVAITVEGYDLEPV